MMKDVERFVVAWNAYTPMSLLRHQFRLGDEGIKTRVWVLRRRGYRLIRRKRYQALA